MSANAESVKEVSDFLSKIHLKFKSEETQDRILGYAETLQEMAEEVIRLRVLTTAIPAELGNVHDLPQDLLNELSIANADEIEDQIVTVINAYGGTANIDQILVGLYRKFKVLQKRRFLQNKLYRMSMVWSVPGKKGLYTTAELESESEESSSGPSGYSDNEHEEEIF